MPFFVVRHVRGVAALLCIAFVAVSCAGRSPVTEVDAGLTCDEPSRACSGNCVDVRVDSHHCGACDTACSADQACAGARCYPRACGTTTCGDSQVCVSGVCADRSCFGVTCSAGLLCAVGSCRPTSCGGKTCGSLQVCVDNTCVDASCVGVACPAGAGCSQGSCRIDTCSNDVRDGLETDLNCGGQCPPCATSQLCSGAGDCRSRVCTAGVCAAPSCSDGVRNGDEGDVDCGGPCAPCAAGQSCTLATQCASSSCTLGTCRAPTCTDTVRNGAETDIDCGGGTCPACGAGKVCAAPADCMTAQCSSGRCISAMCSNSARDGSETDVDCGGSCSGCATGKGCDAGIDCFSSVCGPAKTCLGATCTDNARNAAETDVDCGGGTCPACLPTRGCLLSADCTSRVCSNKLCAAATCTDKCGTGKFCLIPGDCQSALCTASRCLPSPILAAPIAKPLGTAPYMVVTGDLDLDGVVDIAVSNNGSQDVSIYFSQGDGGFAPQLTAQTSGTSLNGLQGLVIADFSGDGTPDIATGKTMPPDYAPHCRVNLLRGAGNRTFLGATEYFQQSRWTCGDRLVAGEFTGDTRPDLWIGGASGAIMSPGTATGFDGTVVTYQGAGGNAAAVDFDRDGDTDIVTHNGASGMISTFRNTGSALVEVATFGVSAGGGDIASARLNADTFPDIAVAARASNRVGIAFGVGDGNFLAPVSLTVTNPDGIAIGDLNGDGNLDLVVGGVGIVVLRGNGDGTFQPAETLYAATLGDVGAVALGDFNRDSKLDVACLSGGQLWILYNTTP